MIKGADGHHLAAVSADLKLVDIFGLDPKLGFGLNFDLVGTPELVKIVDIGRPQKCLQGAENIIQRNIQCFGLGAIHIDKNLGDVCPKQSIQSGQTGLGPAVVNDLARPLLQLGITDTTPVLQAKVKPPAGAQALDDRRQRP